MSDDGSIEWNTSKRMALVFWLERTLFHRNNEVYVWIWLAIWRRQIHHMTTRVKDTTRRVASIFAAIQLASWCISKMAKRVSEEDSEEEKKTIKVGLASMHAMGKAASRWSATIPATRRVASIFAAIQLTAWCLTIRNLVKQCRHTRSSHHQMGRRYS